MGLLSGFLSLLPLQQLYDASFRAFMYVVEQDVVPDFIIRAGIRYLLRQRLTMMDVPYDKQLEAKLAFIEELKNLPIAVQTATANEQHYEVPTEYFLLVLGPHLKYSACYYNSPSDSLEQAERNMLAMYCSRAGLQDGQDILELGCGWGSFSLFAAAAYPNSRVTAVSNSRTQKAFIMQRAKERGINNLEIITADMVEFQAPAAYDRIVSIEMFEHMKNYRELLRRISTWLRPGGKLFVHYFCHKHNPYHFEVKGEDDWMAKYFFSGGTMPSCDLLLYFQRHLQVEQHCYIDGTHYSRNLEAWLRKQDRARSAVLEIFRDTYGSHQAVKWLVYWRLFYLACSELFNLENGNQWGVAHFTFVKPAADAAKPAASFVTQTTQGTQLS